MTIKFTGLPSKNGEEPTELLKPLTFEYLAAMNRLKLIELLETVGTNGHYVLLVVIPNAKVDGDRIVETDEIVGKTVGEEKPVGKEGE